MSNISIHKAKVEDFQNKSRCTHRETHIYLWTVSGPRADWKRRERCLKYPYIHSQHVPHYIWTSSTLFRYLLQSLQRCGSFFSWLCSTSFYCFFYLASLLRGGLKRSLSEVAEVIVATKSISYRSEGCLQPKKNLWASAAEKALGTVWMYSRTWYGLNVFPFLVRVECFSALGMGWMFSALDTGRMFSRSWYGLGIFPRFVRFECLPALDTGCVFLSSRILICLLVFAVCRFLFYWRWSLARQGRRLQNHGKDGWRH